MTAPLTPDGRPMVEISMAASELVPTGQYANVSIGPASVRAWIDPDEEDPFTIEERVNIAKAVNELAELVEADVIAVQRNLVLESLQEEKK